MALVDPNQAKLLRKDRGTNLTELRDYFIRDGYKAVIEHRFCPTRKWRFDLSVSIVRGGWDIIQVALEVQGGIHTRGRHTQGASLLKEMEKLNTAASLGWRVVYCTPADVRSGKAKEIILACL